MDYKNLNKPLHKLLVPVDDTKLSPKKQFNLYVLNDKDRDEIRQLCIKNVPFWNTLNNEDMEVKLLMPVLTNQVFKVTLNTKSNFLFPFHSVFVKKTTQFNTLIYDKDLQFEVAKLLGDNNCGPKVLGRYGDYTIQQWVEGSHISRTSIPISSTLSSIASSLAKFHKKGTELAPKEWDTTPFILPRMELWAKNLETRKNFNLNLDHNMLSKDLDIYKMVINNHVNNSNSIANYIMFCHNDLYFTNILDLQYGLYLLDFDYSGFNYVGWDIANFFHKTDIEYDETEKVFKIFDNYKIPDQMKSIFVAVYLSQLLDKNVLPSDVLVKEFLDSVEVHMLGVNLFWAFWGIIMLDKPSYELGQYMDFYDYSKYNYGNFKNQLKKLTEEKKIEF